MLLWRCVASSGVLLASRSPSRRGLPCVDGVTYTSTPAVALASSCIISARMRCDCRYSTAGIKRAVRMRSPRDVFVIC